jgi:hypothetical protein
MIVAGPVLVEYMVKTNAGKKLYDTVEKEFPVELWHIVLNGIWEIEQELKVNK